jgi:hypothetical protein
LPLFRDPDPDAKVVIDKVLRLWHSELADAGVTVACVFAYASGDGDALTHHGYPAAAVIAINPLDKRVQGMADATIKVDGRQWQENDEEWKLALIDHELTHLSVMKDQKTQKVKTDDAGRPKLRLRVHDWENGGFDEIVSRHKGRALEYRNHVEIARRFSQREFNWG